MVSASPAPSEALRKLALALFSETFRDFAKVDDFTILYPDVLLQERNDARPDWFREYLGSVSPESSYSAEFSETTDFPDAKGRLCEVRVHACRCFQGRAWALTVRWSKKPDLNIDQPVPAASVAVELAPFEPGEWSKNYLFGTNELVNAVWAAWPASVPSKGLVLVTGETGSQKSQMTRGLIYKYLTEYLYPSDGSKRQLSRKPHLLTFEDPVESWLRPMDTKAPPPPRGLEFMAGRHIDYTPRVLSKDVLDLETGLMKDALRQTPSVVYAGELRQPKEFRACLDFAGTGHLVIATAHAGSVIEAMSKLLRAVGATTSGERAIYAPRILSILHLKKLMPEGSYEAPPVVPAMWRQTATGIQQLVSDGLVSLLPTNPKDEDALKEVACLGRSYFVEAMMKHLVEADDAIRDLNRESLRIAAFRDDLNLNA